MFYGRFACLIVTLALAGCAAQPWKVDVGSASIARTKQETVSRVAAIRFVNRAADPVLVYQFLDDTYIPLKTAPSTRQTVEDDLRAMLGAILTIDANAPIVLNIKVQQAEAFWVSGIADRIPFVGFATVAAQREFLMKVKFSIEVEKSGKVGSTYVLEEKYSTQGSAALASDIKASYERLIAHYRQELERSLRGDFIARYL